MGDFGALMSAQAEVRRWVAECANADARRDLARTNEACAHLLSQHEPLASLGMDREHLRCLLAYVRHHDLNRLTRELAECQP